MLGRHLEDVASVSPVEFLAFVRERCWPNVQGRIALLQELFKAHGRRPAYWAADCDRHIASVLRAATEPSFGIPVDLLEGRSSSEALGLIREMVRRFGQLLAAWPDVVDAAATLRSRGITLAQPR
jgi:hypothetical protein